MSKVSETCTISVCPDCLVAVTYSARDAYADISIWGGHDVARDWERRHLDGLAAGGWSEFEAVGEGSYHFSWSPCDICEGIAGDRYDMEVTQS